MTPTLVENLDGAGTAARFAILSRSRSTSSVADRAAMLRYDETEHRTVLNAVAKKVRRRAEAPDKAFVEHIPGKFMRIFNRNLTDREAESPPRAQAARGGWTGPELKRYSRYRRFA